ncbi:WD repeat protein [Talaromyces stipitatus ATCC 10500]|uniref:WD repeat protein n=1 Tax=Talaromyces stipitatus (strain ATCC 10500 / CBS 375.48 / QM 6759 / NRRL 1006) TaxID=441959 RepID=B8MEG0_TALSN|nr:WD repeat protein [Talaromyces stipitatus ATCC 10500]EED16587.1 WD repeat protein [Talaromyces stipitatus ATCC 10500]
MADPPNDSGTPQSPRPPPPSSQGQAHKVYQNRATSALARLTQPFFTGSRSPSPSDVSNRVPDEDHHVRLTRSKSLPGSSQTVTHRTGLSIASLDISPQKTHAVIAGREIFKTIRVSQDGSSEEFNLRDAIIKASSKKQALTGLASKFKDQLAIKDVKWSHGEFDTVIATAAANGRIITYDLQRAGLELSRLNGHNRQVHKLAFNPHRPAWLLSGSQDSTIRMWDLSNSDAVRDIRWSTGDGTVFATATDSGAIQCWDYRHTKAPQLKITAHEKPCYAVDWHPDGKHLVSAGTDKQVKVWDFSSSAERRQKPTFQFRAPQPVVNVRWRPASRVSEFSDDRNWQSTQVVTSYDKEDPRIHLWDLRRPHIPYREIDRYETPPADMLWKSNDLLWTVGEAGAFTQTDIRYVPEVVSRRPMCAVAWSPTGEVVATVQKRPRRRPLATRNPEFFGLGDEKERVFERHRSFADSSALDDIATTQPKQQRGMALGISKSLGNTPPDPVDKITVIPLGDSLSGELPTPNQVGIVGRIEGVASDEMVFRYLAEHGLTDLDWNATQAEMAGQHKLAQTWSIVKYTVLQEIEHRAEERKRKPKEKTNQVHRSPHAHFSDRTRLPDGPKSAKVKSHLFKGVMETEAHRRGAPEIESSSNVTTPLAQPLPDSPSGVIFPSVSHGESVTDDLIDLQPLPPSVMSSRYSTKNQNETSTPRMQRHESESSEFMPFYSGSFNSEQVREGQVDNSKDDQRTAPRAIAGRVDWHRHRSSDAAAKEGSEDDYEQNVESRKALLRDYKAPPKKVLNLESLASEASRPTRPGTYFRHDSTESFPMFSASTDSSQRTKSVDISLSPRTSALASSRRGSVGWETEEDAIIEEDEPASSKAASVPDYGSYQDRIVSDNSYPDESHIHLQRPSSPAPIVAESDKTEKDQRQEKTSDTTAKQNEDFRLPLSPEISANKPWGAQVILREAVRHYYSTGPVDTQMAAHLLRMVHSLFYDCETILPYHECEQVFKAYNEQLIRHSMYVEAAELRNFCVPIYPAVYEYSQTDTYINVYCYTCRKPYENPVKDNRRCHKCRTPQPPCPICLNVEPPLEWTIGESDGGDAEDSEVLSQNSLQSDQTEPISGLEIEYFGQQSRNSHRIPGSSLWSWCQGCGHGGHLACMKKWLSDLEASEGGCPTPGCVHDCGPGPRRREHREVMQTVAFGRRITSNTAKRDSWVTGESRAVEKVRGMLSSATAAQGSSGEMSLGGAVSSGGSAALNTSSGGGTIGSSKKVRLVTPIEEGLLHKDIDPLMRDKESTSDPFSG